MRKVWLTCLHQALPKDVSSGVEVADDLWCPQCKLLVVVSAIDHCWTVDCQDCIYVRYLPMMSGRLTPDTKASKHMTMKAHTLHVFRTDLPSSSLRIVRPSDQQLDLAVANLQHGLGAKVLPSKPPY